MPGNVAPTRFCPSIGSLWMPGPGIGSNSPDVHFTTPWEPWRAAGRTFGQPLPACSSSAAMPPVP